MRLFVWILSMSLLAACSNEKQQEAAGNDEGNDAPQESLAPQVITPVDEVSEEIKITPAAEPAAPEQVNVAAGPDGVVPHYVCPDRCEGGTSHSGGDCPVCGKKLAHNQAYHAQPANDPAVTLDNNLAAPSITPAAPAEPAQNAKGVWHYTCPKGCPGGGPTAGPCSVCGTTLAHNAAYHN